MNNIVPRQSVALAIFACCVSAYMVVRLLSGLVHAYYLGPILDEWAFVPLLARFYTGHLTLSDLWAQHNEHRPLFSRVLYLLDYVFFRGTKEFLFTMTYVFQTTHVLLLSWVLYHYADISRSARVIGVCVIVSLLFSAAQVETLHMAIGVQWSGLCMLGTATFLTIAGMAECNTQGKTVALLLILAIVLAAAATCDLASGILLWPLMLGLCLWLRLPSRYAVAIAAAGGVILFLYLKNYHSENFLHSDPLESLRSLNKVFVYAAAYLGSPVQVLGARACVVMGTLGIGIGVLTVLHVLLYREPLTNVRGALAAILCFLMGTALLTGLGRINFGLEQAAFSSRYMTITLTCTAGIAVILGVPDRDLLKTLYPFPEELMNLAPIL
jgi:hypothetical protein